jgi:hypothetical protein
MIDMYDKCENPENPQRYHNQDIDKEDIHVMTVRSWPIFYAHQHTSWAPIPYLQDLCMFADCHIATNFIATIVERVTYCKRSC